ncbi:MAG: hypothetical protein HC935_10700 [Pseudanabaena sp. SU_2_4]|nr:hypothetical protein [Pseudanabaena sp. SU_2_4]
MNVTEISQFIRQAGQKGKQLRADGFEVMEKLLGTTLPVSIAPWML